MILEDVEVPADNVLGEIGQGHKIAFNILNIGRFKLGAGAVGAAKRALDQALAYTLERKQFGRRIAEFGVIREKLAADVRAHLRGRGRRLPHRGADRPPAGHGGRRARGEGLASIEEYSVECAMMKVLGSEMLDYVVDETVQMLRGLRLLRRVPGGAPLPRQPHQPHLTRAPTRSTAIIVPTMLLRKAASGQLALAESFEALGAELRDSPAAIRTPTADPLAAESRLVANLKKICVLVLGLASDRHGKALAAQQAVQLRIADLAMLAYTAESAWLRAAKALARDGERAAALPLAAARITCEESVERAEALARQALVHLGEREALGWLARLVERDSADTVALREEIAAKLVELERLTI